jgi:hypothetical protein
MELQMDVMSTPAIPWSPFLEFAPRPGVPCLREIFEQHFTDVEIALLERGMRPDVESGKLTGQSTNVYLTADKPA